MMRKAALTSIFATILAAFAPSRAQQTHLEELTALSVGAFTTIAQSRRDLRYGVAEAEIVRIWPDASDGAWTYQEQAFLGARPEQVDPTMKERPYFARVIHSVEVAPGVVRRSVHRLKAPDKAAGDWRDPRAFDSLSPRDLEPSDCVITAERIAEKVWRAQSEKCPNDFKGAAYALSLGVIADGWYANWDRGFAADGVLVWGPDGGGYIFERKETPQ